MTDAVDWLIDVRKLEGRTLSTETGQPFLVSKVENERLVVIPKVGAGKPYAFKRERVEACIALRTQKGASLKAEDLIAADITQKKRFSYLLRVVEALFP